jgi:hypothetical protein
MSEVKGYDQIKTVTSWADDDDDDVDVESQDNRSVWGQPAQQQYQDLASIQAEQEAQRNTHTKRQSNNYNGSDNRGYNGSENRGYNGSDNRGYNNDGHRFNDSRGDQRMGTDIRGRNNRSNYGNDYGRGPRTPREQPREREQHREREQYPIPTSPPYTAVVSNLPWKITEDELYEYFKDLEVNKITLITDRHTKKFAGRAFIEFNQAAGLSSALLANKSTDLGRVMYVEVAPPIRRKSANIGNLRPDYGKMALEKAYENRLPTSNTSSYSNTPLNQSSNLLSTSSGAPKENPYGAALTDAQIKKMNDIANERVRREAESEKKKKEEEASRLEKEREEKRRKEEEARIEREKEEAALRESRGRGGKSRGGGGGTGGGRERGGRGRGGHLDSSDGRDYNSSWRSSPAKQPAPPSAWNNNNKNRKKDQPRNQQESSDNSYKEQQDQQDQQEQQEEVEFTHDVLVDSNIEYDDIDTKPEKNNYYYRPKAESVEKPVEQPKTTPEKPKPPVENQKSPQKPGKGRARRGRGGRDGGQRETTNEVANETFSEPVEPPKESPKESPQKPQEDKSPGKSQPQNDRRPETGGGRGKTNKKTTNPSRTRTPQNCRK